MKRIILKIFALAVIALLAIVIVPFLLMSIVPNTESIRSDNKAIVIIVKDKKQVLVRGWMHPFVGEYIKNLKIDMRL